MQANKTKQTTGQKPLDVPPSVQAARSAQELMASQIKAVRARQIFRPSDIRTETLYLPVLRDVFPVLHCQGWLHKTRPGKREYRSRTVRVICAVNWGAK